KVERAQLDVQPLDPPRQTRHAAVPANPRSSTRLERGTKRTDKAAGSRPPTGSSMFERQPIGDGYQRRSGHRTRIRHGPPPFRTRYRRPAKTRISGWARPPLPARAFEARWVAKQSGRRATRAGHGLSSAERQELRAARRRIREAVVPNTR